MSWDNDLKLLEHKHRSTNIAAAARERLRAELNRYEAIVQAARAVFDAGEGVWDDELHKLYLLVDNP